MADVHTHAQSTAARHGPAATTAGPGVGPSRARVGVPLLVPGVLLAIAPFVYFALRRVGGLEFPLDDGYIYLQYSRQLAAGRLFEYFPGAGYSTGCTSFLYPLILAPGFWLGLDGRPMVAYTFALSIVLIAGCAWVASRLGQRAAGRMGAVLCPAFLLATGSWMWGALSGLEVALLTLLTLLAVDLSFRDASDAVSLPARGVAEHDRPDPPRGLALWIVAALLALTRPEGLFVAALVVALSALRRDRRGRALTWIAWPAALLPCLGVGLMNLRLTGQLLPNTAIAKSAALLPRQTVNGLLLNAWTQLAQVGTVLLRGWHQKDMIPLGPLTLLVIVVATLPRVAGEWRRRASFPWTILLGASVASMAAALTARWPGQLFRYYHPTFATLAVTGAIGWAILIGRARAGSAPRTFAMTGAAAVALTLGWVGAQQARWAALFGDAAYEIRHQQVYAAEWIAKTLPSDATLMLNDVGAMAYIPRRRVFDLVGLVTNHQARVFVEGPGALFEKLERMPATERPTHLVVYPEWLRLDPLLGRRLFEARVSGHITVIGERAAIAFEPDWHLLESGERPSAPVPFGDVLDAIDVADLDDETAHRHEFAAAAPESLNAPDTFLRLGRDAGGREIADGGRSVAGRESFDVRVPDAGELHLRARLQSSAALEVLVDGSRAGELGVPIGGESSADRFDERDLVLPALAHRPGRHRVEIVGAADAPFRAYHYWLWGGAPPPP
jgi:hypothetical protein